VITTRVKWVFDPGGGHRDAFRTKMQELLGDQWEGYDLEFKFALDANGEEEGVRPWPDFATAKAWIDFVNSFDNPPVSAIIVTE
jgi:hypothetical protein